MIYLDSTATKSLTEKDDLIIEAMTNAMKESWQNPSSLYNPSVAVKNKIEEVRKLVADYIGAKPNEIYFTSSGSESNNWAIKGFADKYGKMSHVITSSIEHKSILECVKQLYCTYSVVNVDEFGLLNLDELTRRLENESELLRNKNVLVSVQAINNELGTIQHIKEISDLVHKYNGSLHIDAVQMFGKYRIDVNLMNIDMMTFSGHKLSPVLRGVACLYIKNGIDIEPLICGSQERGKRGGTENTYAIIGLGKAIDILNNRRLSQKWMRTWTRHSYFVEELKRNFGCKINGYAEYKSPYILSATFPQNVTAEALLYMLDMNNIYVATGSACNSKSIEPSYVLKAIGLTDEEAMRTVRFSIDENITYKEIDKIIEEIGKCIKLIECDISEVDIENVKVDIDDEQGGDA